MLDLKNPEIQFAINAVRQATLMVRQIQLALISPAIEKDDRSPVTVADFASQAIVGRLLTQAFPQDLMIAEEDSATLQDSPQNLAQVTNFIRQAIPDADKGLVCTWIDQGRTDTADRFWTLDPIDGTKGFLRGDQYAIALALVVNGQVQIGALGCPNLADSYRPEKGGAGSLAIAARGQGAWSTGIENPGDYIPLHVSTLEEPRDARLLRSYESGHTNVSQVDILAQKLGIQAQPVRMDSQAKYAVQAAGHGEIYLRLISPSRPDYREKIWDQAAGSMVLEEAGGRITDLDGNPLDFTTGRQLLNNRGVLASNGPLHAQALGALKEIGA